MKLNVQGVELEILRGGASFVDGTIGIMAEISFVESYRNRPFFSDIDSYLRSRGFKFFDMVGLHCVGRANSAITEFHMPGLYPLLGQLIEALSIYFRDPIDCERRGEGLEQFSLFKILQLICFAEVFGQIEYAFELLARLPSFLRQSGQLHDVAMVEALHEEGCRVYRAHLS